MTFARRVVATAWSRDLQIDHQVIEDVRLIDAPEAGELDTSAGGEWPLGPISRFPQSTGSLSLVFFVSQDLQEHGC